MPCLLPASMLHGADTGLYEGLKVLMLHKRDEPCYCPVTRSLFWIRAAALVAPAHKAALLPQRCQVLVAAVAYRWVRRLLSADQRA